MGRIVKIVFGLLAVAGLAVFIVKFTEGQGGPAPIIRDEAIPLAEQWFGDTENRFVAVLQSIPAAAGAVAGIRAGQADYDKSARYDELTSGVPIWLHRDIMHNDNLGAAQRARLRVLRALIDKDPGTHFYAAFREWFNGRMSCLSPQEQIRLIGHLNPPLMQGIVAKNTELAKLHELDREGVLTVKQREEYMAEPWRVRDFPAGPLHSRAVGDAKAGATVRPCIPEGYEAHSSGRSTHCTGYLEVPIFVGRADEYEPFSQSVFRHMQDTGALSDLITTMKEQQALDSAAAEAAAKFVGSLPATALPSDQVTARTKLEYERQRCATHENF